jgi:diguanylate cyclase (GGDEF)-like protein/PAS domain S-box-containing protein
MLGYLDEEISSSPNEWFDRVHPDDQLQLKTKLDEHLKNHTPHFECEYRMLHRDGNYRYMLTRGVAIWNTGGFAQRMAGSQTDITERKRIEEQLRHGALHDALTGLGNRTLLIDRLAHVNQRKQRMPELLFALLFLDIDRFKLVNDSYGHQVGDQLLIEMAHRLTAHLRSEDRVARMTGPETVVRIAGDEFVVLLEGIRCAQDAEQIADRVIHTLAKPFVIRGNGSSHEITIRVSVGIVIPERTYEQAEDIIRDADIAMYKAKQSGGDARVRFAPEMYDVVVTRMQLEHEMRRAVERHEFVLHYQPIYSVCDDTIIGFEALARWNHPSRGLLAPKDFIGPAEETGLIVPIGYEILRMACTQMKQWQYKYKPATPMIVSVNLSVRQLATLDLVAQVKQILEETGFEPEYLWLELTETILIEQLEIVKEVLVELRRLGIHIEIDDFGVGYSSLSYLQHLPVDGFKIDRSFVSQIQNGGQQIVSTLIELGKNLGLTQIAEGVETEVQKEYLQKLSCGYMQGYLMGKPMGAEWVESFLDERGLAPALPAH